MITDYHNAADEGHSLVEEASVSTLASLSRRDGMCNLYIFSPLHPARKAHIINTEVSTPEEVVAQILPSGEE